MKTFNNPELSLAYERHNKINVQTSIGYVPKQEGVPKKLHYINYNGIDYLYTNETKRNQDYKQLK